MPIVPKRALDLYVREIDDPFLKENFRKIQDYSRIQPFLNGDFQLFEITIDGDETNLKYRHNLNFVPTDIIQTFQKGAGTWVWNYDSFDGTNLDITTSGTSGTITIRAFIGRFDEGAKT